jgi:hypothetical protein
VTRRGISQTEAAFIQKPFTSEDLMRKVREVLDSQESDVGSQEVDVRP